MPINSDEEIPVRPSGPEHAARKFVAALGAIATVAALAACGSTTTASSAAKATAGSTAAVAGILRIGFSPLSLDEAPLQAAAAGMEAAAKATGKFQVVVADPKTDVTKQVNQLEQWIQLRAVNAIWVIPIAPAAIEPVIKQAQAANIPILIDALPSEVGMTTDAPGVSFSKISFTVYGNALGQLTGKCIGQRLSGKAQIIFLKDSIGQVSGAAADAALLGAVRAAAPGSAVVRTVAPNSQLTAQQDTLSALQGAPNANAALASNDESALGALSAFQQAGKNPKNVCIVGGGGGPQSLAAVKAGTLYGEVAFNFQADTQQNIAELEAMHADPTAPGKLMTVPVTVIGP
jgi:ABC-type sugar transport system substrate-binding protein